MEGRLRRLGLVPLLVLGVAAAGCGGDDEEQTTLDLTGLGETGEGATGEIGPEPDAVEPAEPAAAPTEP